MILLMITTNVTVQANEFKKEVVLKKGDIVLEPGVLVPEYNYREYLKSYRENQVKKEYELECPVSDFDYDARDLLVSGILGFAIGLSLGSIITSK